MTTEQNFPAIKAEILRRAKEAHACTEQYGRAYKSETIAELMTVIKDNFWWAADHGVLTVDIIEMYSDEFAANDIFANVSVERGYLLCDNATVEAWGNATVRACDNATVEAWGNATVRAWGNATVRAYDNATVEAYGNATVEAYGNAYISSYAIIECKLSDKAIWRVRSENTVYYASDDIKFVKQ